MNKESIVILLLLFSAFMACTVEAYKLPIYTFMIPRSEQQTISPAQRATDMEKGGFNRKPADISEELPRVFNKREYYGLDVTDYTASEEAKNALRRRPNMKKLIPMSEK